MQAEPPHADARLAFQPAGLGGRSARTVRTQF